MATPASPRGSRSLFDEVSVASIAMSLVPSEQCPCSRQEALAVVPSLARTVCTALDPYRLPCPFFILGPSPLNCIHL